MVYCSKCGTANPESANTCSNCSAPLFNNESRPYSPNEYRKQYPNEYQYRKSGGSGIGLLIAGLFIVIIGVVVLTGFTMFWRYFWPVVLILIGVWIVVLGLRRNRRYRQQPPA